MNGENVWVELGSRSKVSNWLRIFCCISALFLQIGSSSSLAEATPAINYFDPALAETVVQFAFGDQTYLTKFDKQIHLTFICADTECERSIRLISDYIPDSIDYLIEGIPKSESDILVVFGSENLLSKTVPIPRIPDTTMVEWGDEDCRVLRIQNGHRIEKSFVFIGRGKAQSTMACLIIGLSRSVGGKLSGKHKEWSSKIEAIGEAKLPIILASFEALVFPLASDKFFSGDSIASFRIKLRELKVE